MYMYIYIYLYVYIYIYIIYIYIYIHTHTHTHKEKVLIWTVEVHQQELVSKIEVCMIESNWFLYEFDRRKPDRVGFNSCFFEGRCTFYPILFFKYFTENREQ